jgi:hypothetical protein
MASRSPPSSKRGRREDDDDESRRRKKLEKGKEPTTKDAEEEPFLDDTKFAVELLRSTFRKLEGVGMAFDIKEHHDLSPLGSTCWLRSSRTSPWSSGPPAATSSSTTAAMAATTATTAATTVRTVATATTTAGLD